MEITVTNLLFCCCILFTSFRIGECNPRCFFCDTRSNPNCIHPKDHNMEAKECTPNNVGEMKLAIEKLGQPKIASLYDIVLDNNHYSAILHCVKTVIKGDNKKEDIIRGCQLAPTSSSLDICEKLRKEDHEDLVTHCSYCNENACNSTSFLSTSFALICLLLSMLKAF